jgi:hypothetical protein
MDLLTWPNVTLDQFQDLLPELKHLAPCLKERVMIEGMLPRSRGSRGVHINLGY